MFRDLEKEYQDYSGSRPADAGPRSLWEELADIGEELVEFLEKVRRRGWLSLAAAVGFVCLTWLCLVPAVNNAP